MGKSYLAKVGLMGVVNRLDSPDFREYSRDEQVICRTQRGLEVGQIICSVDSQMAVPDGMDSGQALRPLSPDDQLILARLNRHRDRAFQACQSLLEQHQIDAVLVDVEHLFDGKSLYFYFMGNVPDEVHALTEQLCETYETKVRFRKFAETLINGCGPTCGTVDKGCSSGRCSNCGVSGRCGVSA